MKSQRTKEIQAKQSERLMKNQLMKNLNKLALDMSSTTQGSKEVKSYGRKKKKNNGYDPKKAKALRSKRAKGYTASVSQINKMERRSVMPQSIIEGLLRMRS